MFQLEVAPGVTFVEGESRGPSSTRGRGRRFSPPSRPAAGSMSSSTRTTTSTTSAGTDVSWGRAERTSGARPGRREPSPPGRTRRATAASGFPPSRSSSAPTSTLAGLARGTATFMRTSMSISTLSAGWAGWWRRPVPVGAAASASSRRTGGRWTTRTFAATYRRSRLSSPSESSASWPCSRRAGGRPRPSSPVSGRSTGRRPWPGRFPASSSPNTSWSNTIWTD